MSRIVSQAVAFAPWPHQVPSMQARANGVRWVCKVWHRRAGKDVSDFISSVSEAHSHPGIYYHCFPELAQGRKAFWDGRDNQGTRYIDYLPSGMLASKPNETEMQLELRTKDPKKTSLYQVVGADRLGWIGSNPRHVTMSEYQDQDPTAWHLLSPILMANKGGASFCFTPRGHNHAYELYNTVKDHPAWHTERLTVLDTRKPDGTRIVTDEDLDFERTVLKKKEAIIQQEYFCDFEGDQEGSVYGDLLQQARRDGRVTTFAIEPGYPIIPVFDIGHHDATAIGFYQTVGPWRRLVDYVEAAGKTVDYFAEVLKQKRFDLGYRYDHVDGKIFCLGPHDLRNKHWGSPHSAEEVARQCGLHFRVLPKMSIEDGLAAGRRLFPHLWIHEKAAARMVQVFGAYRYEWDAVTQSFGSQPIHDWSSHGADQYRYFALSDRDDQTRQVVAKPTATAQFDPLTEAEYEFNPFAIGA